MSTELDRLLERVRQARDAAAVAIVNGRRSFPCAESRTGCTHRIGDRVFDTVSGQEGTVASSTLENVIVSTPKR